MLRKLILGLLALGLVGSGLVRAEAFTEDFEAAISKAEKEKKDLLLDFTGSDWCAWCIKLKEEVLGKEDFVDAAQKQFVLVELDYPRGKKQTAKIKDQNALLQKAFKVDGFPSVYLADSQGRAYARTGYQEGGVESYLKHLETLREIKTKRDLLLTKANSAQGVEKAKLLDEALSVVPDDARVGYDEIVKEIGELDPEDKSGLKTKYESQKQMEALKSELEGGDPAASLEKIAKFVALPNVTPAMKQQAYFWKAQMLNSQGDKKGVVEALEASLKQAPDSDTGKQVQQILQQVKSKASE